MFTIFRFMNEAIFSGCGIVTWVAFSLLSKSHVKWIIPQMEFWNKFPILFGFHHLKKFTVPIKNLCHSNGKFIVSQLKLTHRKWYWNYDWVGFIFCLFYIILIDDNFNSSSDKNTNSKNDCKSPNYHFQFIRLNSNLTKNLLQKR